VDLDPAASWPSFGGDPGNTGTRGEDAGPTGAVETAWRFNVDGIYTMPGPVVSDGTVYVGSGRTAYAVDATDGVGRWEADLGALAHHFSPAADGGSVYFAAQSNAGVDSGGAAGAIGAFGPDGDRAWRRELPVTTSPKPVDDALLLGESADAARLVALDRETGAVRWRTELGPDLLRGAPAVGGGSVVATASAGDGESGAVVALERATGERRWSTALESGVRAAPAVRAGTVHVETDDGRLLAYALADGTRLWEVATGVPGATAPAVTEELVVALVENRLVGVTREEGTLAWTTDVGYATINGVSVVGDVAYVGGGRLSGVDVDDGTPVLEVPVPGTGGGFGAPVALGNVLFVGVCIKREATDPYDDYLYSFA
jgi:outer membrane protein assembly factor BamB